MKESIVKVSIIIPVYKVEAYLVQCLDSISQQTFKNWECILVDDGSPDRSGEICDEYAKKDHRFRVIHKENGGVSSARNVALDVTRGEYVAFIDSDDLWAPRVLERVCNSFETEGIDWVRIRHTNFKDKDVPPVVSEDNCFVEFFSGENVMKEGCSIFQMNTFSVLNFFKRSLIGDIRYPLSIRFREDAIFLYEMVTKSKGLAIDSYKGYLRRQVEGSATFSPRHSDDSYRLYEAFSAMIERSKATFPDLSYWFYKDLTQWLGGCPDIKPKDEEETRLQLRKLYNYGVINRKASMGGTLSLRLILYAMTGCRFFLYISRQNPLGKVKRYKTTLS